MCGKGRPTPTFTSESAGPGVQSGPATLGAARYVGGKAVAVRTSFRVGFSRAAEARPILEDAAKERQRESGGDRKSENAKSGFPTSEKPIHVDHQIAQIAGVATSTQSFSDAIGDTGRTAGNNARPIWSVVGRVGSAQKTSAPLALEGSPTDRA
jgi:hypothetical protein